MTMFILLLTQLVLISSASLIKIDLSSNLTLVKPLAGIVSVDTPDPFCLPPNPFPLLLVNPQFNVYTRTGPAAFRLSNATEAPMNVRELERRNIFAENRQVVFIVHGFMGADVSVPGLTLGLNWMIELKNKILIEEDSTVIIVDWRNGADFPEYATAASNTITTAYAIATVARAILDSTTFNGSLTQSYFYCIGHSLGAQICGQAGRQAKTPQGLSLFDPSPA